NGTRVNGTVVQIRRLRIGDRLSIGRSVLLFGSNEEIAARVASLEGQGLLTGESDLNLASEGPATVQARTVTGDGDDNLDFDLNLTEGKVSLTSDALLIGNKALPPLPQKMSPSQAARFAEILDFLHRGLTGATDSIQAKDDGTQVALGFSDWQK